MDIVLIIHMASKERSRKVLIREGSIIKKQDNDKAQSIEEPYCCCKSIVKSFPGMPIKSCICKILSIISVLTFMYSNWETDELSNCP